MGHAPHSDIVTRFAPSPTGYLHIGGARTALFNWAFARHYGGQFLIRIEDTDRARSTQAAVDAIFDGLNWLGLSSDAPAIFQHEHLDRHLAVAHELKARGHAYVCTCSSEDIEAMREKARLEGRPPRYDGRCREAGHEDLPGQSVIRFKSPQTGSTIIHDIVQGAVSVDHDQLDDLILVRSDGTPTYMLSVVVDDHDMGITHVIRGDDHLTNAFRQTQLYQAMDWALPVFAHIPLIHGSDGAKLSKRHGALGADAYRDMGILPEAMRNYLARLGWSHGDDEIFSTEQLVDWFSLEAIGRSPARLDLDKLMHINAQHLRQCDSQTLLSWIIERSPNAELHSQALLRGMDSLKERAQTLNELVDGIGFIIAPTPIAIDDKARKLMTDERMGYLAKLLPDLEALDDWTHQSCEACLHQFMERHAIKLGQIGPALRAVLTGTPNSPGLFDILLILGQKETLARIRAHVN